jgi:hypothetical protein
MLRIIVLFFLFVCSVAYSGTIEKAFDALNRKDYFIANQLFRKSLKKNPSISAFGLTQLYLKHDYLSIDSAYRYILVSEKTFSMVSEKSREKFKTLNFDSLEIQSWKQIVSDAYFETELKQLSEVNLQNFINKNPWSRHVQEATFLRDSIAFDEMQKIDSSRQTLIFLSKYSKSVYAEKAINLLLNQQYKEETKDGNLDEFEMFIEKYPDNFHVVDAENRIYEMSTASGNLSAYREFIIKYPKNRNISDAWKKLYQIYMKDFNIQSFESFAKEFPEFPFKEDLIQDQNLFFENYFPVIIDEKFGYMNSQGQVVIEADYDEAGPFKEGLAVVLKDSNYGIINKKNEHIVDFVYDQILEFNNGRAIVLKDEFYNVIDRSGRLISSDFFKDLTVFNSKVFLGLKDSVYSFYDMNLNELNTKKYQEIGMLINGFAIVQNENLYGLIDSSLVEIISPRYDGIQRFDAESFIYTLNGKKGILNEKGLKFTEPIYDDISVFNYENNSAIVKIENNIFWIHKDGTKLFETAYEYYPNAMNLAQFSRGYAIIKKKGKFGLIDDKGKITFKPVAELLGKYVGAIPTTKLSKWGLIDFKSKVILPFEFELIEPWESFGILIQKEGLTGLLDYKLGVILPISFTSVKVFDEQNFIVTKGAKCGLFNFSGREVLPVVYDRIQFFEKDCLILYKESEIEYYFTRTNIHLRRTK